MRAGENGRGASVIVELADVQRDRATRLQIFTEAGAALVAKASQSLNEPAWRGAQVWPVPSIRLA